MDQFQDDLPRGVEKLKRDVELAKRLADVMALRFTLFQDDISLLTVMLNDMTAKCEKLGEKLAERDSQDNNRMLGEIFYQGDTRKMEGAVSPNQQSATVAGTNDERIIIPETQEFQQQQQQQHGRYNEMSAGPAPVPSPPPFAAETAVAGSGDITPDLDVKMDSLVSSPQTPPSPAPQPLESGKQQQSVPHNSTPLRDGVADYSFLDCSLNPEDFPSIEDWDNVGN
jgi:hypothetical protein